MPAPLDPETRLQRELERYAEKVRRLERVMQAIREELEELERHQPQRELLVSA